jgi:hypothetical protein
VTRDNEITELEKSDFYLEGKTLLAASFTGDQHILQVFSTGYIILNWSTVGLTRFEIHMTTPFPRRGEICSERFI